MKKRVLPLLVLVFIANGLALTSAIILQSIWAVIIILGGTVFTLYWFYATRRQKKKPRYPMVPPEGKGDIYFPRTDIPRPIHEDFRRIEEKKRRFEKIRKMARRKKK